MVSFAVSTINSGWPWQIDNRTGAGYDFVNDTYFLPDHNGDPTYADDNIAAIDASGIVLNAWEMDVVRETSVISWTAVSDTHGSAVYLPVVLRSYGP